MHTLTIIEREDLNTIRTAKANLVFFNDYYRTLPAERKYFTTLLDAQENLDKFLKKFEHLKHK